MPEHLLDIDDLSEPTRVIPLLDASPNLVFLNKSPMTGTSVHEIQAGISDMSLLNTNDLERAEMSNGYPTYCSLVMIRNYWRMPFVTIDTDIKAEVIKTIFDDHAFWKRGWNVSYMWPVPEVDKRPLTLVLLQEVRHFFDAGNRAINGCDLRIEPSILMQFPDHSQCTPIYLGSAHSAVHYQALRRQIPDGPVSGFPENAIREQFEPRVCNVIRYIKDDLQNMKADKDLKRKRKLGAMAQDLELLKRFLGLHPPHSEDPIRQVCSTESGSWQDFLEALEMQKCAAKPSAIDPQKPSPFAFESSVIFISVDVEAYEFDHAKVTEIGIATLDTRHIADLPPGVGASDWRPALRARHIRINEHLHLSNSVHVHGCADRFNFGESEFINLRDVPAVVASCFRHPFSNNVVMDAGSKAQELEPEAKPRTLVLVGHDVEQDVQYLRRCGYDVGNLRQLHRRYMDTAALCRVHEGVRDTWSLGRVLDRHDIDPWHLHNAGNDAALTMHALLAIAVDSAMKYKEPLKEWQRDEEY